MKELSLNIKYRSEAYADVLNACSNLLKHNKLALDTKKYLDNRISPAYQKKFGFGYFPDDENLSELIKIVGEDKLRELNLIYDKWKADSNLPVKVKHGIMAKHNLVMPYKNVYGDIVALVGRTMLSKGERQGLGVPKYKNTIFHKGLHIFGLYHSKKSIIEKKAAIVVEGQFDCISCHSRGFNNVVALGGVNFTKYQFSLLSRYTNKIYLLLDNDGPGISAAEKIINRYSKYINIEKVALPSLYKDIDEYFLKDKSQDIFQGIA